MRDYQLVSPSLEGVLYHDSLAYEGVSRPLELLRALDGPAAKGRASIAKEKKARPMGAEDARILERYFNDLYGIFQKKLSAFAISTGYSYPEGIKLQAILQELVKVKRLISPE